MSVMTERRTTPWETRPGWGITVDLTPREVLQGRRGRLVGRLVSLGLALVLVLCAALVLLARHDRSTARADADAAREQTTVSLATIATYSEITTATNTLDQTRTQTTALLANDVDVVNLIAQIRGVLPATVTISNLAILLSPAAVAPAPALTDGSAGDPAAAASTPVDRTVIGSVTISGGGVLISDLAPFVAQLNRLPGVVDVLPGSTTQGEDGMTYSVSLNITDVLYTQRFDEGAGQ